MSIEKTDFDSINEADIQELIDAQVPESLRLELKLTTYGTSKSAKLELVKDVSALANAHGGHLIIGMKESAGIANNIVGLQLNTDAEILRMEQILRSGIEPPIGGIRMRAVPLSTGEFILILRVARSWYPPHRVKAQGKNKFYIRHSAGVHEPSIEELRALFNQSMDSLEKACQFRNDRILQANNGIGLRPLQGEGRIFIHIVPIAAFSGMVQIDVGEAYNIHSSFRPLGASPGMTPRFNFHGFINERSGERNYGYTQVFRNGSLEATKSSIIRQNQNKLLIYANSLERYVFQELPSYINGLKNLRVPAPLIILITLEVVEGTYYIVSEEPWDEEETPLPDTVLNLPTCVLEDYGSDLDYHKAVRPAFDALWNATGRFKSLWFNDDGLWVGNQRR